MKQQTVLFYIFIVCSATSIAQGLPRPNDWKKYRKEVFVGMGITNFLGDLGGLDKKGTDYSPIDLELAETRTALSIGYRYKVAKWFNISGTFNYLIAKGDDKLTKDPYRNNRNLNFKTNIFEITGRAELVYTHNKFGHRYSIKKSLSRKKPTWELTAFVGIGGFYYNPKGQDSNGNWVKLRPLHTEGQGLPNGPKQYSNFAVCIPIGVSYKTYIDKKWAVGLEVCYRKTFTDYIDDVSTSYYDKQSLFNAYGAQSVQMSDPNLGKIKGATATDASGESAQRGDLEKDTYVTFQVTVGYIFKKKIGRTKLRSKF